MGRLRLHGSLPTQIMCELLIFQCVLKIASTARSLLQLLFYHHVKNSNLWTTSICRIILIDTQVQNSAHNLQVSKLWQAGGMIWKIHNIYPQMGRLRLKLSGHLNAIISSVRMVLWTLFLHGWSPQNTSLGCLCNKLRNHNTTITLYIGAVQVNEHGIRINYL
jgi:hypothetical protein